jgi:hypothetical protein
MKREYTLLWGGLLIVAGILFLVRTLSFGGRIFEDETAAWGWTWAALFGAAGLSFLWVLLRDGIKSWWAAIPAFALLGLSIIVGVDAAGWEGEGTWIGALFLGMIGLGFWVVYLMKREFWWAIIPGGVLFTLAAVVIASIWSKDETPGAVFFFGLALTFALLTLLPTQHKHMTWPLIPAGVLAVMGAAILLSVGSALNYVWPVALIAVGLWLLYRQSREAGLLQRR